jgi:hypothetical protein
MRPLNSEEASVLLKLLADSSDYAKYSAKISELRVTDDDDGGMGSLTFVRDDGGRRKYGSTLSQKQFKDADGVLVIVSLDVDEDGDLLSMDFWKVDFSRLVRYPSAEILEPAEIVNVPHHPLH